MTGMIRKAVIAAIPVRPPGKTVIPEAGPVETSVLRDWESSFEPKIAVVKRQPNSPEMRKALPSDHTAVGERLAEFVPFLRFDRKIRTVICTTNATESISAQVRRAMTEQSGLKCL